MTTPSPKTLAVAHFIALLIMSPIAISLAEQMGNTLWSAYFIGAYMGGTWVWAQAIFGKQVAET